MILLSPPRETRLPGVTQELLKEISLSGDPLALPPVPQDSASPRAPQGIVTLMPAFLFASIHNPKKPKDNTEAFSAFTGRPKGNDPLHIKLCEAGLAMAKRVFHLPEAKR